MLKYIAKRLGQAVLTLFIIITIIFCLLRMMPEEGYLGANYDKMSELQRETILTEMGLRDPVPVQLAKFYRDLLHGNFGTSWIYRPNVAITEILADKAPVSIRMGLMAIGISLVVALLLGATNLITDPYIKENQRIKQEKAMNEVLPADSYEELAYTGDDGTVDAVYKAGDAGYVVQVTPATSFSGTLSVMVGVDNSGEVTGVEIVASGETSGLGSNASKPAFKDQFVGAAGDAVTVTKDGGTINAITGGTDAQGEVSVRLRDGDALAGGRGSDPDIIVASAKAFIDAHNRLAQKKRS